jgi:hypothetical protein
MAASLREPKRKDKRTPRSEPFSCDYLCMKTFLLLLVFSIPSLVTADPVDTAVSTERWLSICRSVVDAPLKSDGTIDVPNTFDAGTCWGGFQTLHILLGLQTNGKQALSSCPPTTGVSTGQLIAIFSEYAKRHPNRYQDYFAYVAVDAMAEAFPCRAK